MPHAEAGKRAVARRFIHRTPRHRGVYLIDELPEFRIEPVARMFQGDVDLVDDPARMRREHDDAIAHQHGFFDIMRDEQNRLDRHAAFDPEVEEIGAQSLGRQHIERGEGLVHQKQVRIDDERAAKPTRWRMPPESSFGKAGLKAVETDEIDRLQGAACRASSSPTLRALRPNSTLASTVSQGNKAKLWNTMATPSTGPVTGLPR